MDERTIAAAIFAAAQRYAERKHARLGPGADHDFRTFAARAAADIARDDGALAGARTQAAVLSFERLIDEMIVQSRQIPGYEVGLIGEQTLTRALSRLCPLWPFCQ